MTGGSSCPNMTRNDDHEKDRQYTHSTATSDDDDVVNAFNSTGDSELMMVIGLVEICSVLFVL